jgi:hypothetical protein
VVRLRQENQDQFVEAIASLISVKVKCDRQKPYKLIKKKI